MFPYSRTADVLRSPRGRCFHICGLLMFFDRHVALFIYILNYCQCAYGILYSSVDSMSRWTVWDSVTTLVGGHNQRCSASSVSKYTIFTCCRSIIYSGARQHYSVVCEPGRWCGMAWNFSMVAMTVVQGGTLKVGLFRGKIRQRLGVGKTFQWCRPLCST